MASEVITHPHLFDSRPKCATDDIDFRALAEARVPLGPDTAALLSSLTDARRQAVAHLSDLGRTSDAKNAAVLEYVQLSLPLVGELQQGEQQQVGRRSARWPLGALGPLLRARPGNPEYYI